jgi:hydrogenase maturation protease
VIGIGNRYRSDDAAGLAVIARLEGLLPHGVDLQAREDDPTTLLDVWESVDRVWLVDAVRSRSAPGSLHRVDAIVEPLPVESFRSSTHHVGLAEVVELARTLGRLPQALVVLGVEGASFDAGERMTPAASAAVGLAAETIREEVVACSGQVAR